MKYLKVDADAKQTDQGVKGLDTKDPKQTEKGVPEIKPGIEKSDIGNKFKDADKPMGAEYVTNPEKMWEDLARETEKELKEVENTGASTEHPEIHKKASDAAIKAAKEVYAAEYFKGKSKEELKKTWDSYGGDFSKCLEKAKSWSKSPEGYCAALEEAATGKWPAEK